MAPNQNWTTDQNIYFLDTKPAAQRSCFFFFFPVCYQNISFISVLAALRNLYKKKKGLKQCLVPVINGLIFFQISISGTWIHNLDIQDQSYLRAAKIEFFFLSIWGI